MIHAQRIHRPHDEVTIVNAARVSFDRHVEELGNDDIKLIKYLVEHNHWTPLGHPQLCFHRRLPTHEYVHLLTYGGPGAMRVIVSQGPDVVEFIERASLAYYLRNHGLLDDNMVDVLHSLFPHTADHLTVNRRLEYLSQDLTPWVQDRDALAEQVLISTAGIELSETELDRLLVATFLCEAPIFVARQMVRHTYDLVWNEVSGRYVRTEPELHRVTEWRRQAASSKQGSTNEVVRFVGDVDPTLMSERLGQLTVGQLTVGQYQNFIAAGIAGELARVDLPLRTMTKWYWTGGVHAWKRIVGLRCAPDAQKESALLAEQLREALP